MKIKINEKTEELLHNLFALICLGFLYYIYDLWTPSDPFPSGWRPVLFEVVLSFLHNNKLGLFIGKGGLITLALYYLYKIYVLFKIKKK
ncbi:MULTISPECIES: hypothetical protein [Cellulophaga]|uniref:hypothetical protein n=1 Tax=Cellulophaga TaxID=104264 RepID=UPI0003F7AA4B|nr:MULTISPECIES: hypothetical protein [Cellulophaga]KGK29173.1 hypothetical protein EL45_18160 [Cellulophaga sp. E6(2014)]MBA6314671.1 hypothetical protein [Cellulophaga baltica]